MQNGASAGIRSLRTSIVIKLCQMPGNGLSVQGSGPKKWFILGVSLTYYLVESRDLFFLEAEMVENIFDGMYRKICGR